MLLKYHCPCFKSLPSAQVFDVDPQRNLKLAGLPTDAEVPPPVPLAVAVPFTNELQWLKQFLKDHCI